MCKEGPKIFNPAFVRSLVYAGIGSNAIAIIVCLLFKEFNFIPGKSMSLSIWAAVYFIHRKFLGTW